MSYHEDKTRYVYYFDVKHLYLQLNLRDVFIHIVLIVSLALLVLCPPGKLESSDAISYNQYSLSFRELKKLYHLKFLLSWSVGIVTGLWQGFTWLKGGGTLRHSSDHCWR